jgi:hypothetical protein
MVQSYSIGITEHVMQELTITKTDARYLFCFSKYNTFFPLTTSGYSTVFISLNIVLIGMTCPSLFPTLFHLSKPGATNGIGKETARVLALRGAKVIIPARTLASGQKVKESLADQVPSSKLHVMEMDLSSLSSVRNFARSFDSSHEHLNILMYVWPPLKDSGYSEFSTAVLLLNSFPWQSES